MKTKFYRLCVWNLASRLLQIGHKSKKWQQGPNLLTWRHSQIFLMLLCFLVKFSCCSKFHVNIITGSGVMTTFFIRDWPEIRKSKIPPSKFCSISGGWDELEIPNFAQNVSKEMLVKTEKCQGYSFYCFWVVKGKPTGRINPSPRLGLKT